MKIQIVDCHDGNWYKNHINCIFDVESNNSGGGYTLINTPDNEELILRYSEKENRIFHLERLREKRGIRLGVDGSHAVKIINGNNKDYRKLLAREW